jgi:hypothetical protein
MRFEPSSALLMIVLTSACVDHSDDPKAEKTQADASVAETSVMAAVEHASVVDPSCVPPPDCSPIRDLINIDVCCSDTLRCGWDLTQIANITAMHPEDYGLFGIDPAAPCAPRGALFFEAAPQPEKRVAGAGDDILVTPGCTSRNFVNTLLAGCCLPDDTCGLSTAGSMSVFVALLREDFERAPFTFAECVHPKELNAQLAETALAPWAFVPPSKGKCDYDALDARLPRLPRSQPMAAQ